MSIIKIGRIVGKYNGPAKGITPTNSLNDTALATKKYVDTSTSNIAGAAGDISRLLEATSALEQRVLNMRTSMQPSETGVSDFRLFAAEKKQELIEIFGERGNIEIPPVEPPVTPVEPPVTPVEPPVDSGTDTDPNENKWTTVGGIEFVDSDGTVTGGTGGNGHDAGHNTTVGKIEFS